jgi:crotonobetainyl-CoA:carnitine CoA-transferase CaiB-like acyl-CoA transferase
MTADRISATTPLAGVTVVDFSPFPPGQLATRLLAQLGADVVMVERPDVVNLARETGMFLLLGAGKRSVALNLKDTGEQDVARELLRRADVVVEGFRPGVMDRLGLGFDDVRQLSPWVVYCSISGYGQDGPYRLAAGHDLNYMAAAGVVGLNHDVDGHLVRRTYPVRVADVLGGMFAAVGVLGALAVPRAEREARHLDIALADAAIASGVVDLGEALHGKAPTTTGAGAGLPTYRLFETRDQRWVSLGISEGEDVFWATLCRELGLADWAHWTNDDRQARAAEIVATLERIFRSGDLSDWVSRFVGVDVPFSAVATMDEVVQGEFLRERLLSPDGVFQFPIGQHVADDGRPAPALGAHTDEIRRELTGPPT